MAMKRTFAVVALLAALGVLSKLAVKPMAPGARTGQAPFGGRSRRARRWERSRRPAAELLRRYADRPEAERALVGRVAERFRQTATAIDHSDGIAGLRLLDKLDIEAIYLYEKHPKEFHRLREILNDDAAADVLLHWREYFGLKRGDDTDRAILVAELAQLNPAQRRLAARYPSALPLILADPSGVAELIESCGGDETTMSESLVILSMISLEQGASDLRAGLRTLENHRTLALDAFRQQGLQGFALVCLYGQVLDALGGSMPLDQSLIVLRVNSDYVDQFLQTHRPETLASHLGHVAARGLVEAVGGGPQALRLAIEFGEPGERALAEPGPMRPRSSLVITPTPPSGTRRWPRSASMAPWRCSSWTSMPMTRTFARSCEHTAGRSSRRSPRPTRDPRLWRPSSPRIIGRSANRWQSWPCWRLATTARR